jgi:hypothetical protein
MPKKQKPKQKNKSSISNKKKTPVEKQKTPRNKEKYPALNFKRQVKTRLDQLDIDYVAKLNDEEKDFLNRFLEETVITNFKHKGPKIYSDPKPFYNSNNARNKCIYTGAKALGILESRTLEGMEQDSHYPTASDVEDAMIHGLELARSGGWEDEELSDEERAELIALGVLKG